MKNMQKIILGIIGVIIIAIIGIWAFLPVGRNGSQNKSSVVKTPTPARLTIKKSRSKHRFRLTGRTARQSKFLVLKWKKTVQPWDSFRKRPEIIIFPLK